MRMYIHVHTRTHTTHYFSQSHTQSWPKQASAFAGSLMPTRTHKIPGWNHTHLGTHYTQAARSHTTHAAAPNTWPCSHVTPDAQPHAPLGIRSREQGTQTPSNRHMQTHTHKHMKTSPLSRAHTESFPGQSQTWTEPAGSEAQRPPQNTEPMAKQAPTGGGCDAQVWVGLS